MNFQYYQIFNQTRSTAKLNQDAQIQYDSSATYSQQKKHSKLFDEESQHIPKINQKSAQLMRTVSDLYKWQEMKDTKQQMMKKYFEMQNQQNKQLHYTNMVSQEIIAQTRQQNIPVENILMQKWQEREDKLKLLNEEVYGGKRVPQITRKGHNLRRDQTVFERLYGLTQSKKIEKTSQPSAERSSSKGKPHNSYMYKSTKQTLEEIIKKKQENSQQDIKPKNQSSLKIFNQLLVDAFKFNQHESRTLNQPTLSERIKNFVSQSPLNVQKNENKFPNLIEKAISISGSPNASQKKQIQISPDSLSLQNNIEKQILIISPQSQVKECFLNLAEVQTLLEKSDYSVKGSFIDQKSHTKASKQLSRNRSSKSSNSINNKENQVYDTKNTRGRNIAIKFPNSKRAEVLNTGQNRLTKVYKYILEKE